jgi:serine/threonine-protein kinase
MPIVERIGNYRILSPIAAGGMGRVYLARAEANGHQIAIKVLPDHFLNDRRRSRYLEREVEIARKLKHPNVIDIYGMHSQNGIGYLLMEYMDAGNLRPYIESKILSLYEVINLILQICAGMHYIHNHKLEDGHFHSIIHRDIKPENILLSTKGRLKVADFGLSVPENSWSLLRPKSRAGTPFYMSPEQLRGEPLDIRTDIFSFGLVTYELLTGQLPHKTHDKELYMKMLASKSIKPTPPSHIDKRIPRQLDDITMRALEKNRADRYQTVAEMILDLQRLPPVLKKLSFQGA